MFKGGPRWSPDIKNGGGWLLVDLLDAHAHGVPRIELCHHHGGGWLLVNLPMKDARDNGNHEIKHCYHHGSRTRSHLTYLSICSHVCYLCICKITCISPIAWWRFVLRPMRPLAETCECTVTYYIFISYLFTINMSWIFWCMNTRWSHKMPG